MRISLVLLLLLLASPAEAQVHQMICSSVDAPGVSITALPGGNHQLLIGACGQYLVVHVGRSAHGLALVGDTTFTWGGASATPAHGTQPDNLMTMRPIV